jgi:hypothetical protein
MELLSYWIPWPWVIVTIAVGAYHRAKIKNTDRIVSRPLQCLPSACASLERREGTGAKRLAKAELTRMAGGERLMVMALSNPEFTEDRCGLVLHRYGYLLGRLALSLEA